MAKNERETALNQFMSKVEDISSKSEVHVTDLNLTERGDFRLALMTILRGKTEEEYFQIVRGLFEAYDKAEGNRVEQDRLHKLSSTVMDIGEQVLGIDWS